MKNVSLLAPILKPARLLSPSVRNILPSKSSEPKARNGKYKIYRNGILCDTNRPLPMEIQDLVDGLREGASWRAGAVSTLEKWRVVGWQSWAQRQTKRDSNGMLMDLLFPEHHRTPMLAATTQQNLDKRYLPPSTTLASVKRPGPLKGPRPDHLFGYKYSNDDRISTAAFSKNQERDLLVDAVAQGLHFPFMSARWVGPREEQTHHQAHFEGALDGIAMIRHLHHFYTSAGLDPAIQETAHLFLTLDMETAMLYVHWQEINKEGHLRYYREPFRQVYLNDEPDVARLRHIMENLVTYAMESRLEKIRDVFNGIQAARAERT